MAAPRTTRNIQRIYTHLFQTLTRAATGVKLALEGQPDSWTMVNSHVTIAGRGNHVVNLLFTASQENSFEH
jgi:hypothetical protein